MQWLAKEQCWVSMCINKTCWFAAINPGWPWMIQVVRSCLGPTSQGFWWTLSLSLSLSLSLLACGREFSKSGCAWSSGDDIKTSTQEPEYLNIFRPGIHTVTQTAWPMKYAFCNRSTYSICKPQEYCTQFSPFWNICSSIPFNYTIFDNVPNLSGSEITRAVLLKG